MSSKIQDEVVRIYGFDFGKDPLLQEAFDQDSNVKLAEIGDSVITLIIRHREYLNPKSTRKTMDDARQKYANRNEMRRILNADMEFTKVLINKGCTSPVGNIGLKRSDAFMEAIVGAIFLGKGYLDAKNFTLSILFDES